ncbi:hypothetical protein Tco_1576815 [Tanacetum coccineum]
MANLFRPPFTLPPLRQLHTSSCDCSMNIHNSREELHNFVDVVHLNTGSTKLSRGSTEVSFGRVAVLYDDEESNHEDASDTGDAPKQQQQYIDNEVLEGMLKNILAGMSISQGNNLRGFLECVDAKRFWEAIRTRFGGNANSKKMQKAVFKQQFEAFKISSSEGLEKGLWRTTEVEDGRDNLHYGYQLKNQLGDQEAQILAYSHAVKKLEAQLVTFQKQQLSLNEKLTFQANEIYEKDESIGTSLKLFVVLEIRDLKGKDKEKLRLRVVVNTGMGVGKSSMGQNDTGTNINSVRPRVNVVSSNVNTVRSRQPVHKEDQAIKAWALRETNFLFHVQDRPLKREHGTSQTPNSNASEEKDEEVELIVVPSAVKITEEKVESRTSSQIQEERGGTLTENSQKEKKEFLYMTL